MRNNATESAAKRFLAAGRSVPVPCTFLARLADVPDVVANRIAEELGIADPGRLAAYAKREPTHREHAGWNAIGRHVSRSELELAAATVHQLAAQPNADDGQDAAFRGELLRRYQSLRRFFPATASDHLLRRCPGRQAGARGA